MKIEDINSTVSESKVSVEAVSAEVDIQSASSRSSGLPSNGAAQNRHSPFKVVHDAHKDDIHALVKLQDGTFLTGSKDAEIVKWSSSGECIQKMFTRPPNKPINFRYWVTSLEPLNGSDFAAGFRDGTIRIFKKGRISTQFKNRTADGVVCKERNKDRINCFLRGREDGLLFSGSATCFQLWDIETGEVSFSHQVSSNDWVYSMRRLPGAASGDESRLVIVVGSCLELWCSSSTNDGASDPATWSSRSRLLSEGPSRVPGTRPHISSSEFMGSTTSVNACFDSVIRCVDTETHQPLKVLSGHRGRVWSIAPIDENVFASGADDCSIRLWDIRSWSCVKIYGGHPGRVSNVLSLDPTVLVGASCPQNPRLEGGAQLSFWDVRGS